MHAYGKQFDVHFQTRLLNAINTLRTPVPWRMSSIVQAPGFDKVLLFVVKDCLADILPAITNIINSSFTNSIFPRAWKRGEVVPHLKDGDHEIPNNNRPISLLPVLSKVVE